MIHSATIKRLKKAVPLLLKWYKTNQRSFIWRGLDRSPYIVLVSEFMLQQTGVKQVEKKLPDFLAQFPSLHSLADAARSEVLRAWQGLGYNRRALNLHSAAKALAAKDHFPDTLVELRSLPGIGLYTANALLVFAHNADLPVVDVNIDRVLSRWWKVGAQVPIRQIYELDAFILPPGRSYDWHQALMDLGSTVCTKRSPDCKSCPIQSVCRSAHKVKEPTSAKPNEKQYWGQPRRVWRGRVLKIAAESERISRRGLPNLLAKKFGIEDNAFTSFILSILDILESEGFIARSKKGVYSLAKE